MTKIPTLSVDLIEELNKMYPPITTDMTLKGLKDHAQAIELAKEIGRRQVVEFLQMRLRQNEENK